MRTRIQITTLLAFFVVLGCGERETLTNAVADADVPPGPAPALGAAASQVDMAFAICPLQGDPGSPRFTGEVIHVRGSVVDVALRGDLEGEGFGVFDVDALFDGFSGPARGNFHFELTRLLGNEVQDGGFEGQHHGMQGGGFSGRAAGHGFGDLEGLKIRYTFAGRGPGKGFEVFGVITDPSGSLAEPEGQRVAPLCD